MRLNTEQQRSICTVINRFFGAEARVYLFGSRTDDSAKGGDIDLLVESSLDDQTAFIRKLQAVSEMQQQLGDQKIDLIVTHLPENGHESESEVDSSPVIQQARKHGIELTREVFNG
ncbi:nucleotidyltransferase domain-containing protein [Spirochaeta dissipatitropha]